ncbi:DUF4221 family protein [Autumnicola musiva]|uniref:DUF4221 family protein n=1 Tax=Autumnicola musiva TaxID=3075589 RepID=A0ABU3D712_9FLAO|nr:DUF4221 family protein [Zunongwangia sp. F117]MDT0677323.1 DUF4221 family protein [Zunongwangia sp. F117]
MKKVIFLILISLTISCKNDNSNDQVLMTSSAENDALLNIVDTVNIPLGMKEYYASLQNHIVKRGDSTYLYRENGLNKTVDVYNWNSKVKEESLSFQGVERFGGSPVLPLAGDSILIGTLGGEIILALRDSLLCSTEPEKELQQLRFYAKNPFKPVKIENEIFMYVPPNSRQSDPEFRNRPLIASYNLETTETRTLNIHYPEYFTQNCWSEHQFPPSFTKNSKNQLVFSFQTGSPLYIYDVAKDSVIEKRNTAESSHVSEIIPYKDCDFQDVTKYFKYLKSTARYRSIIYDEYRNIYYRLVSLPTEENRDGQRNHDILAPLSIMVLDENLNKIMEKRLPNKTYDPNDFFITESGLWISTNNEGSDFFNENTLSYALFEFDT